MRCKNCGWPNKPEATTCSKCGTALETLESVGHYTDSDKGLKQTVSEQEVFGNRAAQPNICPKCSYPLRPGATKCPNCQTDLEEKSSAQSTPQDDSHRQ